MQIIYFTWKYMWNVNKNCEKAKKKCGMLESPLYLFAIDKAAIIGLL